MTINKTQDGEKLILGLEGRLDTTTASQLQAELLPAFDAAKEIKLDFSKIEYVSSAGLRVLLMGEKAARAKEASMIVCGVSPEVMEVFQMTGFANFLKII